MITDIGKDIIWFEYKGDELAWNGKVYLSLVSLGEFKTLEEVDLFWEGYFKEVNEKRFG